MDTQDDVIEQFRQDVTELLPKSQAGKVEPIVELLTDILGAVARIEIKDARVAVERRDIGGCIVELSAAGTAVAASFGEPVLVDFYPVMED